MQSNDGGDDAWLSEYEEDCLTSVAGECEIVNCRLEKEKEQSIKTIWTYFLDSAEHITQLYKDRQYSTHDPSSSSSSSSCWAPFQTAAGNVTKLYKESCEGMRRTNELAIHVGHQRRNKEISEFVRAKRRRFIRRDDLLSFLAGRPALPAPDPRHDPYGRPQHHHHHGQHRVAARPQPPPPPLPAAMTAIAEPQHTFGGAQAGNQSPGSDDLHTFKEALAVRSRAPDLYTFIVGEMARHPKRPASPLDVNMDSPTLAKRPRHYE